MNKNIKTLYIFEIITKCLLLISLIPLTYTINKQITLIRTYHGNTIKSFLMILLAFIGLLVVYVINRSLINKLEQNNTLSFSKKIKTKLKNFKIINIFIKIFILFFYSLVIIYNFQDQLVFHPNYNQKLEHRLNEYGYQPIDINNEYFGWYKADNTKVLPTIIYYGGNGESANNFFYNHYLNESDTHFKDFNKFMIDYPSYGLSKGIASEEALFEMADKTFDYIKDLSFVDNNNIIIIGFSLGTGVASYIAKNKTISKLVLLAPYNNFRETMNQFLPIFYGPLKLLVKNKFDSENYLKDLKIPILIIYSTKDEVVFSKRTDELINKIPNENLITFKHQTLSHNEIPFDQTTLFLVNSFITKQ